ncbi:MAG: PDGLE domain-containing protein [Candidatus Geothermincolales bacterium]
MDRTKKGIIIFTLAGLAISAALALILSPWASPEPDGLERVAEDKGFLEKAEETEPAWKSAPLPDYSVPPLNQKVVDEETGEEVEEPSRISTGLAGLIGTVGIFFIAWGLAVVLKKPPREAEAETRETTA